MESCQQTVPEAITAFLEGEDFEDVIRTAVSLGGDCDTLTCIAGGIAEAFYGVPTELQAECEARLPSDMRVVLIRFKKRYFELSKRVVVYAESAGFIPEEIRKKFGLGEYAEDNNE